MEVDNTMPRERYEQLVREMRENMQSAVDGRKRYTIGEESIEDKEGAGDESGEAAAESSGGNTEG